MIFTVVSHTIIVKVERGSKILPICFRKDSQLRKPSEHCSQFSHHNLHLLPIWVWHRLFLK